MQNYTLSREQDYALHLINDNKLSLLQYLDILNLSYTLFMSALKNIKQGKRIVIFTSTDKTFDLLVNQMEQSPFKNYYLALANDDFISESSLSKLRFQYKNPESSPLSYKKNEKRKALVYQRIIDILENQAKKIFGDRKWGDLVLLDHRTDKYLNTHRVQFDLQLTQQEFWQIRGKIEEAKSLYDESFILSESIIDSFNIVIDSDEKASELKQDLNLFQRKLEKLLHQLNFEMEAYKKRVREKLEIEYHRVSDILIEVDTIVSHYDVVENNTNKTFFFTANKNPQKDLLGEVVNKVKSIQDSVLLNEIKNDLSSIESISKQILLWKNDLKSWHKISENIIAKTIKTLNKNNSDTQDFKELDLQLEKLFTEINKSGIFKEQYENTGLNLYTQYLSVDNLLSEVKRLRTYLNENKELIFWESYFNQQSKAIQHLLNIFKKFDVKEWIPLFEKWYLEKLIHHYNSPDAKILSELFKEYEELSNQEIEKLDNLLEHTFREKRIAKTNSCKNRNKSIFQMLFKKRFDGSIRAFDVIWSEKEMLSHYFPIMIISTKLLRSNRLLKDGKWDQIYMEGTEIFQHIEKLTLLENKICFYTPLANSFKVSNELGLKLEDKTSIAKLLIHQYNYEAPIDSLPLSDKLRAAKKLSKILLSLNQKVRVYQLKNANIISILPPLLNQRLKEKYDEEGIKEMTSEEGLYETVTESILETDREQFLIIQDHLINVEQFHFFPWQLEAIDAFKSAGFTILTFSSILHRSNKDHFNQLLTHHIKTVSNQIQLPKEA